MLVQTVRVPGLITCGSSAREEAVLSSEPQPAATSARTPAASSSRRVRLRAAYDDVDRRSLFCCLISQFAFTE